MKTEEEIKEEMQTLAQQKQRLQQQENEITKRLLKLQGQLELVQEEKEKVD